MTWNGNIVLDVNAGFGSMDLPGAGIYTVATQ